MDEPKCHKHVSNIQLSDMSHTRFSTHNNVLALIWTFITVTGLCWLMHILRFTVHYLRISFFILAGIVNVLVGSCCLFSCCHDNEVR